MWTPMVWVEQFKFLMANPKFTNLEPLNNSGFILFFTLFLIVVVAIVANQGPTKLSDITREKAGFSIGSGSGVINDPNRPPIPPPTEITSLRIYPIKSCRGIEIDSTRLRKSGLTLDRNWMFISQSDKKFLTIRSDPSMTLLDTRIIEADSGEFAGQQMLQISIHNDPSSNNTVLIPAFPSKSWLEKNTTLETVNIWDKDTDGYIYSSDINTPFCDFFKKDVALVYKGPTNRMVSINGAKDLYGKETPHHFADVMSLQIASEASIRDLNKQLKRDPDSKEALTIERFRPNIIVRGREDHPWEEDTWKRIRITTRISAEEALYKIDLDVVARCARCQVPNVDPETAEKDKKEPWDTLMKFRRVDEGGPAKWKPCFGMMCIPKNEGKVSVGGTLEVLETTDQHLYSLRAFKDL